MPQNGNWSAASAAAVSSLIIAAIVMSQQQSQWTIQAVLRQAAASKPSSVSNQIKELVKDKKPLPIVPGIWNTGNTCFMNALLQAMAASPSLLKHFESLDALLEAEIIYSGTSSPSTEAFSRALCAAMHDLKVRPHSAKDTNDPNAAGVLSRISAAIKSSPARSPIVLDLSGLERKLRFISRTFARPHEQQDADELLTITLDVLEKESKHAWRTLAPSLKSLGLDSLLNNNSSNSNDKDSTVLGNGNDHWWGVTTSSSTSSDQTPITAPSKAPLRTPLEGSLLSLIQCEKCGRKSPLRSTPFNVLALPIPFKNCSVADCLKEFVKYESVEGVECSRCAATPGRAPKQPARKRLMIGRLPGVLCLRLQRNQFDPKGGYMFKDQSLVAIPAVLDASEACFFSVLAKEEKKPHQEQSPWKTDMTSVMDTTSTNSAVMLTLAGGMPMPVAAPKKPEVSSADAKDAKDAAEVTPKRKRPALTKVTVSQFEEKNTQYRLVAVIEHLGSAFGGHYVAYRLVEFEGMSFWVRCSDDTVVPVAEKHVLEAVQAYMCIYERRTSSDI